MTAPKLDTNIDTPGETMWWAGVRQRRAIKRITAITKPMLPQPMVDAFYGPVGTLVDLIEPYVESDRGSILMQLHATFGTAVGLNPHFMVGATRHTPTLLVGVIGQSSRARKGTGWDPIEKLFTLADNPFSERIMSGVGSGEVLVHLVRDPSDDGKDPGAEDSRLLLRESELSRLLVVVNRENSTLSMYLREAYDGKPLRNLVKGRPAVATQHHISLIGHITPEELRGKLTPAQVKNGLANRIIWTVAYRTSRLSDPPVFAGPDIDNAVIELARMTGRASQIHELHRSRAAQEMWTNWYNNLTDNEVGLVSDITARAEAHVIRFAMIYALWDGSMIIEAQHLTAALALWDYSVACVKYTWGGTTGNVLDDRVLEELEFGDLWQTEVHNDVFQKNLSGSTLEDIGARLEGQGRIKRVRVPNGKPGRPPIRWELVR